MDEIWIQFAAEANQKTMGLFLSEITEAYNHGLKRLNILLSTPGGTVIHGVTAYNFLKSLPIKVTVFNIGRVDSIGGVMFLAAKERYAVPNSAFLIHGVASLVPPSNTPIGIGEKELNEKLGSITRDRENIARIYIAETKLKSDEIEKMVVSGETLNTDQAIKYGIISEVRQPNIQAGSKVITITDISK